MKEYVVIINDEQEFNMGNCTDMWDALEKFKTNHPEVASLQTDVTVSVRTKK